MLEFLPKDYNTGIPIYATTNEALRNSGNLSCIQLQRTTANIINIGITVGTRPLIIIGYVEMYGNYKLIENVTLSGGTVVNSTFYDRVRSIPYESVFKTDATYATDQNSKYLRNLDMGTADNPVKFVSGEASENTYWILKPETNYVISLSPAAESRVTLIYDLAEYIKNS